ncbi:ATP-binding protein [Nostoc sp.]|uniref:ATP-binding protein n=1 Tax=Nostoc sp. TaxID=1180 RepID=UPI002FF5CC74
MAQKSLSEFQRTLIVSQHLDLAIADNGLGVADTTLTRLFYPFFTTKDVRKGSGLGLSLSYQIVTELHQGKLDYNSTQGLGAEFVVTLPIEAKKN